MAYGPMTTKHLGMLDTGTLFQEAGSWSPDDFTLPFPDRLAENISEYRELPLNPKEVPAAISSLVKSGAEEHGIRFPRSTLNEWLSGGRDPSVSSSDQSTRENIYRLCACLDYDYEQTVDLFEKVFFTRAFNPKNQRELAFRFFALQDYNNGTEGCAWYRAAEQALGSIPDSADSSEGVHSIKDSTYILNETSVMKQMDFIQFLSALRRISSLCLNMRSRRI